MQALLHSLLHTHLLTIDNLTLPPPSLKLDQSNIEPDIDRLTNHIRNIGINMHHLANELRPVQARETLRLIRRVEIEERKAELAALKACASSLFP